VSGSLSAECGTHQAARTIVGNDAIRGIASDEGLVFFQQSDPFHAVKSKILC